MSPVGRTRYKIRNTRVLGGDRNLIRADLVDNVTVHTYYISRRCENIDVFFFHNVGRHIVRDDGGVKAHLVADRRCQPCALEIRSCFGTENSDIVSPLPCDLEHHSDNRFTEALRHNRAVLRKHIHKMLGDEIDLSVS